MKYAPLFILLLFASIEAQTAPILVSPADGATRVVLSPTLVWTSLSPAEYYRLEVSTDSAFTRLVFDDSMITITQQTVGPLLVSTVYYWRVNARNAGGRTGPWSTVWSFTTTNANRVIDRVNLVPIQSDKTQATYDLSGRVIKQPQLNKCNIKKTDKKIIKSVKVD